PPQSITVEILGKVQNIGGLIENGQTFVRLTDLAAALGFVASWDEGRKMPVVAVAVADKESGRTEFAPTGKFTADEIRLLETIVHWEARGEDEKGQVLVANVVLNRLRNNPTATLHDIVFQPGAFSPTVKPDFNQAQPSATTKSAVKQALDGVDYSQGATFFHALSSISPNVWHEKAVKSGTLAKVFDHGGHRFYKLV
ncbi:MAG: cell wall hydrolase, partial [Turicibacter sp.]|nr:cell wall hydrolase [Turicibacter sp.]